MSEITAILTILLNLFFFSPLILLVFGLGYSYKIFLQSREGKKQEKNDELDY